MLIFSAYGATGGYKPWVTDGTAAGTLLLKDLSTPVPYYGALGDGRVLFAASDGTGSALWITDGTTAGTSVLNKQLYSTEYYNVPTTIVPIGASRALYTLQGNEWITDGTAAGTHQLFTVQAGNPSTTGIYTTPFPQGFTALGDGRFVFASPVATPFTASETKLWVTDGTAAGTTVIDALGPSKNPYGSGAYNSWPGPEPTGFTMLGDGRVVFSADGVDGREPWVTDGTVAGTAELRDIRPDGSSNPTGFSALGGGRVGFLAVGADGIQTFWVTDGTAAGTVQLPVPTREVFGLGDGRALISANLTGATNDYELGVTDGTAAGTRQISDFNPVAGGYPSQFTALGNGRVTFVAYDPTHGFEPWVTDGTAEGTLLLGDITPGIRSSAPAVFHALGNGLALFQAWTPENGTEPWITDGTPAGTMLLKDINDGTPYYSTNFFHGASSVSQGPGGLLATTSFDVAGVVLQGNDSANHFRGQDGADVLMGGGGGDTLEGNPGNDRLMGDSGADRLSGDAGNDTLLGGADGDWLDGGDGTDMAGFSASFAQYALAQADGVLMVDGPDGVDVLIRIEILRFADRDVGVASLSGTVAGLSFAVTNTGNGIAMPVAATAYLGPVEQLRLQYLGSAGGEAVAGTATNDFLNALGGDDAIDAGRGDDVIDGGAGSNFLTGGAGLDTFFLDGRGGATTWSTITDWQAGEQLSLFGWRPGTSRALWIEQDGTAGYRGVTLHADLDGNGVIETSVTWSGLARSALPVPLEYDGLLWFT